MKTLTPYIVVFAVLLAVSVLLSNQDPITAAVVEARSETAMGAVTMDVANQAVSFVMKVLSGAAIAGFLSFAWMEGNKWYRRRWSQELTRRWKPGPNANFQQQAPRQQKLTDRDLLMLAMANNGHLPRSQRLPRMHEQPADAELDIEL